MTMLILLSIFFCPVIATAQINPEPPPLVRFTGSFVPRDDTKPVGLSTLTVSIKETKWLMKIAKVEKLTGRTTSGTRLLESIFPRKLHFTGPEELLNVLRDPHIEGQIIVIEGRLYVGGHMFFLTNIATSSSIQNTYVP